MFDTLEKPQAARPSDKTEPGESSSYRGPERRATNGLRNEPWLTLMLDEIDYGMLVLSPEGHLLHANHTARAEMDACHPLQLLGTELRARHSADVAPLREALQGASERKLRRLLTLGPASHGLSVAVVPLAAQEEAPVTVLLVFGKQRVCQELSTHWFARQHGLTPTETQVLQGLCQGRLPGEVASQHSVALSTVRSQISSIRAKTGAQNIRDLVQKVASLPPLVSALRVAMR